MKNQNILKAVHLLLIAALIAVLTISIMPTRSARADTISPTSDLVINILYIPKHAKACEIVEAFFSVTNRGPDPAYHLYYWAETPDELEPLGILRAPDSLDVGQTATFSVVVQVTGYVVKKTTVGWFGAGVGFDSSYPEVGVDPNQMNNVAATSLQLISKPLTTSCWQ